MSTYPIRKVLSGISCRTTISLREGRRRSGRIVNRCRLSKRRSYEGESRDYPHNERQDGKDDGDDGASGARVSGAG
jgi:hypothetical protein